MHYRPSLHAFGSTDAFWALKSPNWCRILGRCYSLATTHAWFLLARLNRRVVYFLPEELCHKKILPTEVYGGGQFDSRCLSSPTLAYTPTMTFPPAGTICSLSLTTLPLRIGKFAVHAAFEPCWQGIPGLQAYFTHWSQRRRPFPLVFGAQGEHKSMFI